MDAFLKWFPIVSTLVLSACVPFVVSLWRSRKKAWQDEWQQAEAVRQVKDEIAGLGQRMQRELGNKVDCKLFDALKERALIRLDFIDKRIDETSAATTKRIDKESERFSELTGKLTKWHEDCRDDLSSIRERLVVVESRGRK